MPITLAPRKVRIAQNKLVGTGWLPPMIDRRDFTDKHPKLKSEIAVLKKHAPKALSAPPASVDLRAWCSPVEDQGQIGSCTAFAGLGIVEYFQRRAFGKHLDGSHLFVYKATRNLLHAVGDTGAWLRNAVGALALCGVPNEEYWPYTDVDPDFDVEPPQFVYAVADNFEAIKYFAHDPLYNPPPPAKVVASVKSYLAAGLPAMFGFWGYPSFGQGDQPGHIPLPTDAELQDSHSWGHAIVAVGYDDYVLKEQALDFWSLISMDWVDSDQFF